MTAVSENAYFDVLDDVVNKNHNPVYKTIKMKPIDVTSDSYAEYNDSIHLTKKILNLKLVTMLEFQNIKIFLLKDTLQIGHTKFLLLVKLKIKIQFLRFMLLAT